MSGARRIDILDVAARLLEDAGMKAVTGSLSDAATAAEATILSSGMPMRGKRYWDGSGTTVVRLTVIVKRIDEAAALADAEEASRVLGADGAMRSANGSYLLVSCEADRPRLMQWDRRGRIMYVLDVSVEYEDTLR